MGSRLTSRLVAALGAQRHQWTLAIDVPPRGEPLFGCRAYGRCVGTLLGAQLLAFGLWQALGGSRQLLLRQVDPLKAFLRAHTQCSWRNVMADGRWWAGLTAHLCHRDIEHLATNLATLVVPSFLLQRILPWWGALAICGFATVASSMASLGFIYWAFAPAEPRRLGLSPLDPPRFADLAPALRCPSSHDLLPKGVGRDTATDMHTCDKCGREIHSPARTHRCDVCDYDLCPDCALDGDKQAALRFKRFLSAFDEFCFLREAELCIGFDTMTSDKPFVTHPEVFQTASRLHPLDAAALCSPYMEWWRQSSRGSMGSSALAASLATACACWLGELACRGWRHPLLLIMPGAAALQIAVDLKCTGDALMAVCDAGVGDASSSRQAMPISDAVANAEEDSVGHLAGAAVGAVFYAVFLRRRARGLQLGRPEPGPMYPLMPVVVRSSVP
mmetsp:Transcript_85029/g.274845  ORF Transcript_85029/g.274845 Transcript_85029/m.274845 type:complete len:445 (-) Transcript_85029:9-1343(-)